MCKVDHQTLIVLCKSIEKTPPIDSYFNARLSPYFSNLIILLTLHAQVYNIMIFVHLLDKI